MRKLLFFVFFCLSIYQDVLAQEKVNSNFALKLRKEEINRDQKVSMLLQGDAKQIKTLVINAGGIYKYSAGNIVSVEMSVNQLSKIISDNAISRVEAFPYDVKPYSDSALCNNNVLPVHNGQSPLPQAYDGTGVIIGFIDTGIDFTHPDFKDALGKSRIIWLWDHNKPNAGNTPAPYNYGQEWSNTDIDNSLCTHDPSAYNGHGTHVAGLAAGNGLATGGFKGAAPKADIIMVALNFSNAKIADAVSYIYSKAQAVGKPCVINASLGAQAGLHDGRDLESQAIHNLINAGTGRAFVAAAGNSGSAGNVHLAYTVSATDTNFTMFSYNASTQNIRFHIVADSNNLKNIHFAVGADKMSPVHNFRGNVPFVTPASMPIKTWVQNDLVIATKRLGQVWSYLDTINGDYFLDYEIDPDSTVYNWRLMATGNGSFDLWNYLTSSWSYTPIVSSGLPSAATMPDSIYYKYPDADKTMSGGFQNLSEVIAVTSYINRMSYTDCNGSLYVDNTRVPGQREVGSSIGPSRDGRVKPDIASPGDLTMSAVESTFKSGLISTSQQYKMANGCYHVRSGQTSNACPGVTGIVALYLQKNPNATAVQVQQAIVNNAREDKFTGYGLPDKYWGYGKADAYAALTGNRSIITSPRDTAICENNNVSFIADYNNSPGLNYQWQLNQGSGFVNLNNSTPYSGVTTATLTISSVPISFNGYQYQCVLTPSNSCIITTGVATLTVNTTPTGISFTGLQPFFCYNASRTLTGNPPGGTFNGSGITNAAGIFSAAAAGPGSHTVTYVYTDNNGCSNSSSLATFVLTPPTVTDSCGVVTGIESIESPNLLIETPGNIFTPNEDGVNDFFTIKIKGDQSTYTGSAYGSYKMNIYDRWGNIVFTSKSPNISWDGRTGAGEKVAAGTYFYVVEYEGEKYKGYVTLVR